MKPRLKSRLKPLLPALLADESHDVGAASAANITWMNKPEMRL